MMRIYSNTSKMQASQKVNRIGKYLYNNLDGAVSFRTSSNTADVYTIVLYQVPPHTSNEDEPVHEMTLNLSITTYQNKIRVNIIEVTPQKRTIGYDLYDPSKLENLETAKKLIYSRVCQRIVKAYSQYNFLF